MSGFAGRGFNQNGRTIPTRGITATIQPNPRFVNGFLPRSAGIGGTSCDDGSIFTACRIRNRHTAQFEIHRE